MDSALQTFVTHSITRLPCPITRTSPAQLFRPRRRLAKWGRKRANLTTRRSSDSCLSSNRHKCAKRMASYQAHLAAMQL
jgi:hypothetical protein